jgi:hypothetical protein
MTVVVADLNTSQTNAVLSTADTIKQAATSAAQTSGFTFVANFDGTRNSLRDPSLSGNPYSTNVGAIHTAIAAANVGNDGVLSKYYEGVGTSPT